MNVFIVFHGVAHGGESVVGIYLTLPEAQAALEKVKNFNNRKWILEPSYSNIVESWYEEKHNSWYLEIREFEIGKSYLCISKE